MNTTSSELGAGFFTASHCSSSIYAYDGSAMYQNLTDGNNLIAYEGVDPVPFSCTHSGGCRQGDVAWYQYTGESLSDLGKIAKTISFGSTTVSSGTPRFTIDGAGSYFQGDSVYMMGQASGWLRGAVLNTCYTYVDASDVRLNCQAVASFIVEGGDSGGPVFSLNEAYTVASVAGILHTLWVQSEEDSVSIFSEWNVMMMEFDGLGWVDVY